MKNILSIVLSTLTVLASIQTNAYSSIAKSDIYPYSAVVKTRAIAFSQASSSLIGVWKAQNSELKLYFNSKHIYVTSTKIDMPQKACSLIQTRTHSGHYSVNGNTLLTTEEAYTTQDDQMCGSAWRTHPLRQTKVRGKRVAETFIMQNNGQTLVIVSNGKQTVFQRVSSADNWQ